MLGTGPHYSFFVFPLFLSLVQYGRLICLAGSFGARYCVALYRIVLFCYDLPATI